MGAAWSMISESLRPDRHPCYQVPVNREAEVAGPVESVAADLSGHHRQIALLPDVADVETDVLADELAVAPSSDGVRSNELSAPVVDDPAVDECREERVDVVGVGRLEESGHGSGGRVGRTERDVEFETCRGG